MEHVIHSNSVEGQTFHTRIVGKRLVVFCGENEIAALDKDPQGNFPVVVIDDGSERKVAEEIK